MRILTPSMILESKYFALFLNWVNFLGVYYVTLQSHISSSIYVSCLNGVKKLYIPNNLLYATFSFRTLLLKMITKIAYAALDLNRFSQ